MWALELYCFILQLYFEAYDLGDPSLTSAGRAQVSVEVLRNHAPSFSIPTQSQTINEDVSINSPVADLVPIDQDSTVSLQCIVSEAIVW